MSYFILNNKRERPHAEIYGRDNELEGIALYDYDTNKRDTLLTAIFKR